MIGYILLNQMSMKTHVHHLLHEIPHLDNKSGEPYAKKYCFQPMSQVTLCHSDFRPV